MVVASLESDLASERTSSTIEYLKSQGIHWGQTPYGYTRDENAIPQPDDNKDAVVGALEFYAQGGFSYREVAQHLNKLGYRWRNRQGESAPFNKYAVRSVVSNVLIYAGSVPQGRGKDMRITDEAHNLRELVLITDAVVGQHPPIIEEDLVERVLAARHKRLDLAVRRSEHTYLLTPILYCAVCSKQSRGKAGRRANTGPRYTHYEDGCTCGKAGAHEADVLEAEMLELLDLHFTDDVLEDLHQVVMERVQARPENVALQAQIEKVEHQLERLRELYVLGDIARDEYMAARAGKMAESAELERQLGGADYPLETTLARINQLGDRLSEGTTKQRKQAINLLL